MIEKGFKNKGLDYKKYVEKFKGKSVDRLVFFFYGRREEEGRWEF